MLDIIRTFADESIRMLMLNGKFYPTGRLVTFFENSQGSSERRLSAIGTWLFFFLSIFGDCCIFATTYHEKSIMHHLVDYKRPIPFTCEQCAHFIGGCKCKAFDIIPIEIIFDAEQHGTIMDGQKGDYVFMSKEERLFINVYEVR